MKQYIMILLLIVFCLSQTYFPKYQTYDSKISDPNKKFKDMTIKYLNDVYKNESVLRITSVSEDIIEGLYYPIISDPADSDDRYKLELNFKIEFKHFSVRLIIRATKVFFVDDDELEENEEFAENRTIHEDDVELVEAARKLLPDELEKQFTTWNYEVKEVEEKIEIVGKEIDSNSKILKNVKNSFIASNLKKFSEIGLSMLKDFSLRSDVDKSGNAVILIQNLTTGLVVFTEVFEKGKLKTITWNGRNSYVVDQYYYDKSVAVGTVLWSEYKVIFNPKSKMVSFFRNGEFTGSKEGYIDYGVRKEKLKEFFKWTLYQGTTEKASDLFLYMAE